MPYLTGNSIPGTFRCKVIRIPDDLTFMDILNGALLELTYPWNYEKDGALTPQQMADEFFAVYDNFTLEQCDMREIGEIAVIAGSATIPKWLRCDGAAVSRTAYAALFARIATHYGSGNGSTTFNLPNIVGRSPVGSGTGYPEGTVFGNAAQSLVTGQLPAHSHFINDPGHAHFEQVGSTPAYLGTGGTGRNAMGAVVTSNTTRVITDSGTTGITAANTGSGGSIDMYHPVQGVPYYIYSGV